MTCSASSPARVRWDLLALAEPALQDHRILSGNKAPAAPWCICTAWMTESLCGLPLAACRKWPTPTYPSSAGTSCNTDVIIFIKIPMLVPAVLFSDLMQPVPVQVLASESCHNENKQGKQPGALSLHAILNETFSCNECFNGTEEKSKWSPWELPPAGEQEEHQYRWRSPRACHRSFGPMWALEVAHPPRMLLTTQACCSEQPGLQIQTVGWKQSRSTCPAHQAKYSATGKQLQTTRNYKTK